MIDANSALWIMGAMCIGFFIISVFCAILSIACVGIVVGFKNSTHQIEYRDPFEDFSDDDEEESDFDPFAPIPTEDTSDPEGDVKSPKDESKQLKEQRILKEGLIGSDIEENYQGF